jgi:TonB family protein
MAKIQARVVVGEIRVRRLVNRSRHFQANHPSPILENARRRLRVFRAVELRTSTEIAIPFTRGIFRPAIILPEEGREWPQRHLEFVLAHELAHVYRYDCLTQVLAQVACALFWFHPLVWIAAAQTRKERERACDDVVLSVGHRAPDYAEFLLALGRGLRTLNPVWSTTVAMTQPSQLEVRMKALLNSKLNHRPLAANRVLLAAIITVALLVPAAAIAATARKDTGSISGTVHDPSGAVIPGASVILINSMTGGRIASATGDDGTFSFPSMPAGRYRLEFAKQGFAQAQTGEFWLGPSRDLHQNYTLDLGWVSEEVVVRGHRPAETAAASPHVPRRIRVGGLVQAAKLIKMAKPIYPPNLERKGIEGTVILRAVIGTSGKTLSLEPSNGPDPLFLKSAMDAVSQWQYQPTLLNGDPVEVATTITVVFRLDQ